MNAYAAFLQTVVAQTLSVPWSDGLLICITMGLWGFSASVGFRGAAPARFIGKLLLGATVIRYAQSYIVYHEGLAEGVWPLLWTIALVGGVAMGRRSLRADADG